MAEQIYSESIRKILQNKKIIEDSFKVKISAQNNIVEIIGDAPNEFLALQAIDAINIGFSIQDVIQLKEEDFVFEKIPIKAISRRHDLSQVRGRIIGEQRKVMRNMEYLSDCSIALHDNMIGIIGRAENVKKTAYALKKLISGSKHANVYKYLEEEKAREKSPF
jgi:ribosomal RNA assembly protein